MYELLLPRQEEEKKFPHPLLCSLGENLGSLCKVHCTKLYSAWPVYIMSVYVCVSVCVCGWVCVGGWVGVCVSLCVNVGVGGHKYTYGK